MNIIFQTSILGFHFNFPGCSRKSQTKTVLPTGILGGGVDPIHKLPLISLNLPPFGEYHQPLKFQTIYP